MDTRTEIVQDTVEENVLLYHTIISTSSKYQYTSTSINKWKVYNIGVYTQQVIKLFAVWRKVLGWE